MIADRCRGQQGEFACRSHRARVRMSEERGQGDSQRSQERGHETARTQDKHKDGKEEDNKMTKDRK